MNHALASTALVLSIALACPGATACGFHDDVRIQRGMLNWSYPNALHVGTAVWMAQRDGSLDRNELHTRDELTSEARNRLAYIRATLWLRHFHGRLAAAPQQQPASMAVLLLGPMLWSRYSVEGTDVTLALHVQGPSEGDLVVVTEAPVIHALAQNQLSVQRAIELGVLRLYGNDEAKQAAVQWIAAAGAAAQTSTSR